MKLRSLLILLAPFIFFLLAPVSALATGGVCRCAAPAYKVSYGACFGAPTLNTRITTGDDDDDDDDSGLCIPGRVYDPQTDTTKFTWTVTGPEFVGDGCEGSDGDDDDDDDNYPRTYSGDDDDDDDECEAPETCTDRLKYFMIELGDCDNDFEFISATPSYDTWGANWANHWKRPMPDVFLDYGNPIGKDLHFGWYGVRWFGWHGGDSPPVLVEPFGQRIFMLVLDGNVPEGVVSYGEKYPSGCGWKTKRGQIPGPTCRQSYCGDGEIDADSGEQCDDGNSVDGDGCNSACITEYCGDETIQQGLGEQCDDGGSVDGDGCNSDCITEYCGDGVLHPNLQEQCDDGNNVDGDGCNAQCTYEICGDGILQTGLGEQCDDGNGDDGDGCNSACITEYCGDGVVQTTLQEICDDGNTVSGDGCDAMCQSEYCGDGIVQTSLGETCDDGNNANGDGCDAQCTIEVPPTPTPTPVPSPSPTPTPPDCNDVDITETQFGMDGGVKQQEALIRRGLRRYQKLADGSPRVLRFISKTKKLAHKTQIAGWVLSWSIPSVSVVCGNPPLNCVSSSANGDAMQGYIARTNELHGIFESVLKRISRIRKSNRRDAGLRNRGLTLLSDNVVLAGSVPPVTYTCEVQNPA